MTNISLAHPTRSNFINELAKLNSRSMFLQLHSYRNNFNELANFNIVFHISYENALKKSIAVLQGVNPASDLQSQAKHDLIDSFKESISKIQHTEIEDIDDGYRRFFDESGDYIKGVKLHDDSSCLHIYGFVNNKTIIERGIYPFKNQRPLTIEKDRLRSITPVGKFRQFKITPEQVSHISVSRMHLLPPV